MNHQKPAGEACFLCLPPLVLVPILVATLLHSAAEAAPAKKAPEKAAPKAALKAPAPAAGDALLDAWYTITLDVGTPEEARYGYYNDRAEARDGKLYFMNRVWKLEEGFLNDEQLGAVAKDDPDLTPDAFNFHSNSRSTETLIDGSVKSGNVLTITVKRGNEETKTFRKVLPTKTYLEIFFPLWLGRRIASFKLGKPVSFSTVIEDSIDSQFEVVTGRVNVEKPDAFAKQSSTTKVSVDFKGVKTFWWVNASGVTQRIENPARGQVVEKVDKDKAEAFLASTKATPAESE